MKCKENVSLFFFNLLILIVNLKLFELAYISKEET